MPVMGQQERAAKEVEVAWRLDRRRRRQMEEEELVEEMVEEMAVVCGQVGEMAVL